MAGPLEKEKTKRMQFGASIPPGVGPNSNILVVVTTEGVEWSIKDPPLLTSLRIKWWGQEGEGTTSRIYAKSGAHLLTSTTNLVFPAMCGPKNLSSYFHDMHTLPVEIVSGSGPARVVGKADVDISDLVRLGSISEKYSIMAGQRTVGAVPLTISVHFFPTVVTSFELNEHQAEADIMTPVLPTPRLTTWRAAAASGSKTGVGDTPATAIATGAGPRATAPSSPEVGAEQPNLTGSARREEERSEAAVDAVSDLAGGVKERGDKPGAQSVRIESRRGNPVETGHMADQRREEDTHLDRGEGGEDESTGRASEQLGLVFSEVTALPGVGEEAPAAAEPERVNEPPKGPSSLDAELRALIARAEKLREAMTRASETVPVPVSSAAARLARLELPLIPRDQTSIPRTESVLPDRRARRDKTSRSSLRRIVDVLGADEGLVTAYGSVRRHGRSVLSPRRSSDDSSNGSDGSDNSSDNSEGSDDSDSWAEPDSEDDPRGVAEDELLKELFFAEGGGDRRRIAEDSSDQDTGGRAEAPMSEARERPGLASSVEQATTVRIVVGHLVLGGALNVAWVPPPSCTLSMRFPIVPPAMADVAAAHPPQAMSIVPSKISAKGLVFRHSADFPVRMADLDVRQLWQYGEVSVEAQLQGSGEQFECRGSVPLEDVLSSVPGAFRTSVPLYVQAREDDGATIRSRGFPERRDGPETLRGKLVPGEEQNGPRSADLEHDDVAGGPQSGRVSESCGTGEAEEARASEQMRKNGSDWGLDEGVLFGTLDLEVQLLSSGRGGARESADVPALDGFEAIIDGSEMRESPPSLLVQVKCVELSSGRNELGQGKESEVVLVAKAPRSAGGDVELRVRGPGFRRGQNITEGVVPAPKEVAGSAIARQEGTLVVEVWERSRTGDVSRSNVGDNVSKSRRGDDVSKGHRGDVSEALLGLLRVPLKRRERPTRLRGLEGLVEDQTVDIWDPLTGSNRGKVSTTVWLGSAAQVRQYLNEIAAAVDIQRCARGFAARKRFAALVAARQEEELGMGRGACVKHTFRVTVVGATGLPAGEALYDVSGARAAESGTQNDSSQFTKHAAAQRITTNPKKKAVTFRSDPQHFGPLPKSPPTSPPKKVKPSKPSDPNQPDPHPSPPQGHRFIKYWFPGEAEPLYTRNFDWSGNPRFGAQAWHSITLPVSERIGDHLGAAAHGLRFEVWDRVDTWQGERGPEECHVGAAELQMGALLEAAEVRRQAGGREFRKTFELPIRLAEGIPPGEGFPRLQVELSYQASAVFEHPLAGTVFAPRGQPLPELPIEGVLDIKIIRASGLQAAVAAAIPTSPSLRTVLHLGAHSYVRLSLFPSSHELELQYPPIHTPLQAQTFTPHYGFHRRLSVTVTEEVLEAMKTGEAVLEVWHHAPRSLQAEGTNSWLGTVSVPLSQLLKNEKGITGWYDILSRRGDTVGAIELDIAIAEWRPLPQADDDDVIPTSPEPLSPPRSPPSRGPNSRNFEFSSARIRKLSRALPRAARKQEELMARLTVSVEEVVLPKEGGRADGLQELLGDKRTPPERFYAVHGRYGEAEPCVSRAVPAVAPHEQGSTPPESDVRRSQNGLNFSVPLEHTCEVTAPFDDAFSEYLKDRLAVGIWRVDNRRDPSGRNLTSGGGSRERGRDRLVGTAYVGLSPLLDHGVADLCVSGGSGSGGVSEGVRNSGRQESEAPGAASLSGAFALVHPDAVNLGNARLKVRVLLQLTAKEKEETQPGGHGQEPFGFRSRSLEASREQLSPMAESGSPDVTLGLGDVAGVTSEGESEEGLEKEEEGFGERSLSPERGSEASDDVDEEEWLQQRALRRSAELLRRSKDARAGNVFAENGPDVEEIEGVSEEKEGNAYRTVETRVRSPERAASPMRTEESGGSRRATRMEEKGENNASGLLSEGGEEEFEVSRGPAKRLAGHVTVTAPPKRGPARATGVPISDSRPTPSVEESLRSPQEISTASRLPKSHPPALAQSPESLQAAPTEATTPQPFSSPKAASKAGLSVSPQKRILQTAPEQRYTSVRVCTEAAINLQFTACHSQAEEDFWAGAETSKTLNPARAEAAESPNFRGPEFAGIASLPLRNTPQGLFVSYRWQETGEVVCSPLVGPSSNPKWYHSRHLPLATPSRDRPTDRVLVLKVWKRLPEPGFGGFTHVGGVNTLPLQLGAHARAQEAVPSPDLDRLVGCAAIDLSPLFLGMEELCGWYTIHDLRQRSLGQLKVVVSPVDVILPSYRAPEAEGGEIRLRSPPQRGPPGGASARQGGGELSLEAAVGQLKAEALIEEFKLESQVEEESSEETGLNEEESFGEETWGRESSMEDVRLRLEELQEMSRKILERRGLAEGGAKVPTSEGGVGVTCGKGGFAEAALERGAGALSKDDGANVAGPQGEGEKASLDATVGPLKDSDRDASGSVKRAVWHEGRGNVTQVWHTEEERMSGRLSAQVDVFTSGNGSPEEAGGVEYERDDLEGGQGGDGWPGESPRMAVSFEVNEAGDGNDGWAQASPVESTPPGESKAVGSIFGEGDGSGNTAQASPGESNTPGGSKGVGSTLGEGDASGDTPGKVGDDGTLRPGFMGRSAAGDSVGASTGKAPEPGEAGMADAREVGENREDGNGRAESDWNGASQQHPQQGDSRPTNAGNAPPETVRGQILEIEKGPGPFRPLAQALVLEDRSAFERQSVLEERPAPSHQLPPRPPKREGAAGRYPFTLHSSITFVPAPLKRYRTGHSALLPKPPLEGPWSSQVVRTASEERGGVKRASREEEVEGFRGFSRRVEAVVSAVAASGPVWPRANATREGQLELTGPSEQSMRLVAQAEEVERDGEGQRARASRKKYADKETERIARIMGLRSL